MASSGLAEMGGGRGGGLRDVDDPRWQLVRVAVLTHPKLACGSISIHNAVSISIDSAFGSTELAQGLYITPPESIPIKAIKIISTVVNIVVSRCLCCCY
jgi:hypothetical protein